MGVHNRIPLSRPGSRRASSTASRTAGASASGPGAQTKAPPLIDPTGFVPLDMMSGVINEAAAPFRDAPPSAAQAPSQYLGAIVGVLGVADKLEETGLAILTAPLNAVSVPLPAMLLGSFSLGVPHTHIHPPSTIPPAPPVPMPSMGMVALPGALSVLINNRPAARAGDVGFTVTCCSFGPPFEIAMGSSSVFIAGSRAARIGSDIDLHDSPTPIGAMEAVMMGAAGVSAQIGVASQLFEGKVAAAAMQAAQQAADAGAMVLKQMRYLDPGAPFDIGAVVYGGAVDVLIGGIPMPPASASAWLMKKLVGLVSGVARGLKAKLRGGAHADGNEPGHPHRGACAHGSCPQ